MDISLLKKFRIYKKTVFLILAAFTVLACNNALLVGSYADDVSEGEPDVYTFAGSDSGKVVPSVDAYTAIVMDMKSGRVLCGKKIHEKRSMASTTKIMTAILAIENGKMDSMVETSRRAAGIGGSDIGIQEGKQYTLQTLLYGMLLNSGNDAAIAVAEHIGGSVDGFVKMMNSKAKEIGAVDTSFANPHGLDAEGHYSTAYDMALIARYALKNKTFSSIVSTKTYYIAGFGLYNTNEMLTSYYGADGVKTGYTGKAGRCLITSATRDGMRLISVVLGSPTRYKRAEASKKLLDYCFKNYRYYSLLKEGALIKTIPIDRGRGNAVNVRTSEGVVMPLTENEYENLDTEVWLPGRLKAPVYAGSDLGYVNLSVNGETLVNVSLKAWEDIEKKDFHDYLLEIIKVWRSAVVSLLG
jgi:D-alanyl-D-alanine carboxypeptidase (penicillin-binding protein 5/6)